MEESYKLTADTTSVGDNDDDPLSGMSRFGLLDVINNVGRHDVVLVVRDKKGMKKIIDLIMSTDVWRPCKRPKNKKFLVVRKATIRTLSEGLTVHSEDGELCMQIAGNSPAVVNISLKTFRGGDFEVWGSHGKKSKGDLLLCISRFEKPKGCREKKQSTTIPVATVQR